MKRRTGTAVLAMIMAVGLATAACSTGGGTAASSSGGATSAPAGGSTASAAGSGGASSSAAVQSSETTGSGTASAAGAHRKGGSVTISNESGGNWTCQFNPFNPAVNQEALGFVYEPLVYVNTLKNGATTPMLASSFTWSDGGKTIVFTIRQGVKWNDGQPFSANDVAFTFNLMKKDPSLDLYSLWSGAGLQSVTASGDNVTMTFKAPAQVYFYNFADQVGIVPEHIWSSGAAAAKPGTWPDTDPVGTGPFMVKPCSPNNITYVANPGYWMPGEPYVQTVQYPAYLSNDPANLDLANGKAQWGGQYIPNIKTAYVNKDPQHNHYWFPPVANVEIIPNLDPSHKITSNLKVRQAIAYALDRNQLSQIGESGYEPAANQTGVVTPTFNTYFDKQALDASGFGTANQAKATQLLSSLGYSTSHPLDLTILSISGYTDWDTTLAVVKQQLAAVGINLTVQDLAAQAFDDRVFKGNFDLAYYSEAGGPAPYYELRQMLYSKNSAPIGTSASSNYERYENPAVDKLFDEYASAGKDEQVSITKQIEAYMLKDIPFIPTTEAVAWYQYNTADLAGWPTPQDPFALPAPWNIPDAEQVLLHLYSLSAQK